MSWNDSRQRKVRTFRPNKKLVRLPDELQPALKRQAHIDLVQIPTNNVCCVIEKRIDKSTDKVDKSQTLHHIVCDVAFTEKLKKTTVVKIGEKRAIIL